MSQAIRAAILRTLAASFGRSREKSWFRPTGFDPLDDGRALDQYLACMFDGRNKSVRRDGKIGGIMLLPGSKVMHRMCVIDAFQFEHDTHPISGTRPPIAVKDRLAHSSSRRRKSECELPLEQRDEISSELLHSVL